MGINFTIESSGYPPYTSVMWSTACVLKKMGGRATIYEIEERVIEAEKLSAEEQSILMPDKTCTKLSDSLAWARYYLKKGDALENPARTVWELTDAGFEINSLEDTKEVFEKARTKEKQAKSTNSDKTNPDNIWKSSLLTIIKKMHPDAFERLCQRLLSESGLFNVEVRGGVGDGGVDGIGFLRVGLVSFKVLFQCKRWKDSVGPKEVRDFRGGTLGNDAKGLLITTSTFTRKAKEEAVRDNTIAIDLIDGKRLCDLLKEYELGVQTEPDGQVTIKPEWFDRFDTI